MMKKQTVKKGKHSVGLFQRFWWPAKTRKTDRVNIHLYGPGLIYNSGKDQADWLKLPGGKYFDLYQPHGRTIIPGYRYNPDLHVIEVTGYYHNITNTEGYKAVGRVPGYVNEDNILRIPIDNKSADISVLTNVVNDQEVELVFEDMKTGAHIRDTVFFKQVGRYHTVGNLHVSNVPAEDDVHAEVIIL